MIKMKVNHVKTAVVGSLLVLAGLAVILLPAYAGDLEPSAREEGCGAATATGYSESFSFDEAFKNALDALPADTTAVYPDKMVIVKVVEIGARFGGIMGVAHMYVSVRREADPACLSDAQEQEAERRAGKIRMQLGEVKKLPGPEVKIGTITKQKPIEEK